MDTGDKKQTKKRRILFVDDQINILRGLKRMLRPMCDQWKMEFVQSGPHALEVLAEESFDLVLADMRMPGMDGAQLLTEVKKQYPETVRIILSGQTDKEVFLKGAGLMHQFLSKPCDAETIKATVNSTCSLRDFLGDQKLKKLMSQIGSLPTLPGLYYELMAELRSPDCDLESVSKIIEKDIGMTAKILQMANSAFYGCSENISSPMLAVQVLGLDMIQTLFLSYHILSRFEESQTKSLRIDEIWEHSIRVGSYACKIAKAEKVGPETENHAFASGILHDIGRLLIAFKLTKQYRETLVLTKKKAISHSEAEQEILHATHAELGAYLVGLWGLPYPVMEAIAYHHKPSQCKGKVFSPLTMVHVANALEHELNPDQDNYPTPAIDEKYLKALGLLDRLAHWRKIITDSFENSKKDEQ